MEQIKRHRPVRLTHDAAFLARVIIGESGCHEITDESIAYWGEWSGISQRDQAILKDALKRVGSNAIRHLCHFDA